MRSGTSTQRWEKASSRFRAYSFPSGASAFFHDIDGFGEGVLPAAGGHERVVHVEHVEFVELHDLAPQLHIIVKCVELAVDRRNQVPVDLGRDVVGKERLFERRRVTADFRAGNMALHDAVERRSESIAEFVVG